VYMPCYLLFALDGDGNFLVAISPSTPAGPTFNIGSVTSKPACVAACTLAVIGLIIIIIVS